MRYLMGSKYFFKVYPDFRSKDTDFIEIVDDDSFKRKRVIRGQGKDIIQMRRKPKDELIQDALNEKLSLVVGKFLIPEFNKEIEFEVRDLPKIKDLIERLDEKHLYEKIIYNFYIENGEFSLTDDQRRIAYEEYRRSRKK